MLTDHRRNDFDPAGKLEENFIDMFEKADISNLDYLIKKSGILPERRSASSYLQTLEHDFFAKVCYNKRKGSHIERGADLDE